MTGDCFDYDLHEHPLIKNWHEAKVLKRARLEGIKKFPAEEVDLGCCYSLCVHISHGFRNKFWHVAGCD